METVFQELRCISCGSSCRLYPTGDVRTQYCQNTEFAIWPEGNSFLNKGIVERLLINNKNYLSKGFVFVDFSFANLRVFSHTKWIEWLAKSGLYIVIISDRSLASLANYWISKSSIIQGVIYADDDVAVQQEKIRRLFTGRRANSKRGRSLNYSEFALLNSFISGVSIQQAINAGGINNIYAHKRSLENKLGNRIQKIMLNIR